MKKIVSIFALAALLIAGCTPAAREVVTEDYAGSKARTSFSSTEPIPADGGSVTVTVGHSPEFTVSIPATADWLSCAQADSVLTFSAGANNSAVLRYARVSIIDKALNISITNFDITQAGTAKDVGPVKYKEFSAGPETISVGAKETSTIISVTAEDVPWTITSSNPAFVPETASGSSNATVAINFPVNTVKEEVVATLTVATTAEDVRNASYTITITQAAAQDEKEAVKPAPGTVLAEWYFCKAETSNLSAHFSEAVGDELADAPGNGGCYVEPNVQGQGRLEYYNGCDKAATGVVEQAHKFCKRAIGSYGEPCPYGPWKDDYILWTATTESGAPLAAGTKLHLFFALRANDALIMKYWLVEYLDGSTWKVAGDTKKTPDGADYNVALVFGEDNTSTGDAQENIFIEPTVTLTENTDAAMFRITCVSTYGSDGNIVPAPLNKAVALRFAGEDCNAKKPQYSVKRHPIIDVVE